MHVQAPFPEKLRCLFQRSRYKVLRGGRGSGKSWGVGRALLIKGTQAPLRILCTREVQQSIRDSVHKLLSDQIQTLGLGAFYDIQQKVIRGRNGTEFVFAGLSDQTAESMKSFEGCDIAWVEEAQAVSDRSWTILTPTIRKEASEIWVTYNPELDTDPTHVRFVENPPPDTINVEMNWRDNPWFNDVLEKERQHAMATLPAADYQNIWEGKTRPAVSGAVYADEVAKMHDEHRVGVFPYDAFNLAHVVFDLGWNDHMSVIIAQRHISSLRIVDYIEDDHKTLDWYSRQLRERDYSWGTVFLPHDGGHGDYKTGKTAKQIMEDLRWTVEVLPNQPVADGIRAARMAFGQLSINKPKCERLVECLKRYRRAINGKTNEAGNPVHDEFSHGADAYRYTALAAPMMDNQVGMKLPALKYASLGIV